MSCNANGEEEVILRKMYRGDTFELDVKVTQDNIPVDITGARVWFGVKRNYADQDNQAVVLISSADSPPSIYGTVTILDQAIYRGRATVIMNPIATRTFPDGPTRLLYDVQIKDATGRVTTIEAGILQVSPDITRTVV